MRRTNSALFGIEQRPSAAALAAAASVRGPLLLGHASIDDELVVVRKLFAGVDLALGLDEHVAVVVLERDAVGRARVVDPARGVAAHARVDHAAVLELEQERVRGIVGIAVGTLHRFVPRHALTLVFDDALAAWDRLGGEHAASMDGGTADGVGLASSGLRH